MMVGGDFCGDWKVDFFHSRTCYALTMNICVKVQEVYNGGAEQILPQFQAIRETIIVLTINKMLKVCVGKVGGCKSSDAVGTSIRHVSADDMVLNPTLDVFSAITHGGWNFRGEKCILFYLKFSSIVCIQEGNFMDNII